MKMSMESVLKPSFPMGLVGLAVLLAMSMVQVVQAKEYPVHVRYKDYDNDARNDDVKTYWEDLLKETGFGGIAFGLILSIIIFPLFFICWCRCCQSYANCITCKKHTSKFGRKEKTANLVILFILLICITLCAILLGYYAGESTGDVVDGFDETIDSFDDAGQFLCGGELQKQFFAGEGLSPGEGRLETIRRRIEAEEGPAYLCQTGSVTAFLLSANISLQLTLTGIKTAIDPGLNPMLDTIQTLTDSFEITTNKFDELIQSGTSTTTSANKLKGHIDRLNELDSSTLDIPMQLPETDFTDFEQARAEVDSASSAMTSINDQLRNAILVDLQQTTVNMINKNARDVASEVNVLADSLLDKLKDIRSARMDVVDTRNDVNDSKEVVMGLTGALVAVFIPLLIFGLIGTIIRKPNPKSTGCKLSVFMVRSSACCIWFFVLFLVILAGLASILNIFVDDSCKVLLVGNEKSGGKGLIAVNVEDKRFVVGETKVDLSELIVPVLTCPVGCSVNNTAEAMARGVIGTPVNCNKDNSLALMLGIEQEFNFSGVIQPAIDEIQEKKESLSVTQDISNSTAALERALGMLDLDLQKGYDSQNYKDTFNNIIARTDRGTSNGQEIIEEAEGALEAVEEIDASLARTSKLQTDTKASMEGVKEQLAELEVVTKATIASLDQQAVNLEVLPVNLLLGSYGALQCGWIGKAYKKILNDTFCNQVNDGFYKVVILASLGAALVYLAVFVLIHAGRARSADQEQEEMAMAQNGGGFMTAPGVVEGSKTVKPAV